MPYTFDFDWKHRILRIRFLGLFTDEQLRSYLRAAFKVNFHTQPAAAMVDMSEITTVKVTRATITEIAGEAPTIAKQSVPRVIIAPTRKLFELARLFQEHGKSTRPSLHIVHTENEALDIIGVPNPVFEPLEWV